MNRVRVLILDDNPARHAWCDALYARAEVVKVFRAHELFVLLETERWDLLHLDHDLSDLIKDPTNGPIGPLDGRDVVRWLIAHPERCPPAIWIHTWNNYGGDEMERLLREAAIPGVHTIKRKLADV